MNFVMLGRYNGLFILTISAIISFLMTNSWAIADVDSSPQCVHFDIEQCPSSTGVCKCHKVETASVYCCHIGSDFELIEGLACAGVGYPTVTALHIRNATLSKLDANSDKWRYLVSLSITDSHIPRLIKWFGSDYDLTCLNLSNNGLSEVNPRVIQSLPKLSKLDLSHNNLTDLPEVSVRISHFFIDIADNPHLLCHSLSHLVTKYDSMESSFSVHFLNENSTFCVHSSSFHWFNSTDRVPFHKIKIKSKLDKDCPQGEGFKCDCDVFRFDSNYNGSSRYSLQVDCSHKKLTALPKPLPPFTVKLNVSYNNITGIDELSVDESYANIRYFYADHNQVKTFTVLEGSRFLDDFVHLSLDHNNIKTLPIYILSNAIDRISTTYIEITLGENPIQCDCTTAQVTRYWLVNNRRVIRDYDAVWCENYKDRVIELDQNKVCMYQKDWSDYIHYIIAIEILLFVLLISKVSYDYWVFKSAGYLPWPASKMPKLPCDWVFE